MARRPRAVGLVAFALSLGPWGSADANGRFPAASQLAVDPSDPEHLAFVATYGLVETWNGGRTWSWICETSYKGVENVEDAVLAIMADGTQVIGVASGVRVSQDPRGCAWESAPDPLAGRLFMDLTVEKGDPSRAIAVMARPNKLFESTDHGRTWSQKGADLPDDFDENTLEVAPSDPRRIYVSGPLRMLPGTSLLARTDDGGDTWTRHEIQWDMGPGDAGSQFNFPVYIGAISPTNPDVVYVRVVQDVDDRLIVTTDGGVSWKEIFRANGALLGFALSPDGAHLAVGGPMTGIHIASTADHVFRPTSPIGARCLTWAAAGLYACATEITDGFTVGLSKDDGATFLPINHLAQFCSLDCAAGAPTASACLGRVGPTQLAISGTVHACGDSPNAGADAAGPPAHDPGTVSSGEGRASCSCRVGRRERESAGSGWIAGVAVLVCGSMRRRRVKPRSLGALVAISWLGGARSAEARPIYLNEVEIAATSLLDGSTVACPIHGTACAFCHLNGDLHGDHGGTRPDRGGPFYLSLTESGWHETPDQEENLKSLVPALAGLAALRVDSDHDGADDLREIADGYDPNVPFDRFGPEKSRLCDAAKPFPSSEEPPAACSVAFARISDSHAGTIALLLLALVALRRQLNPHRGLALKGRTVSALPIGIATPAPHGTVAAQDAGVPVVSGDVDDVGHPWDRGGRRHGIARRGAQP